MDGGAWWAPLSGVAQSRTWLKRLSISIACTTCNLPTFHCPVSLYACVFAQSLHLVWLFDTPWTAARQAPLSCLCLLRANEQWLQSSNLTLSVVSWKHRMWIYRWNFVQYGPQEASQHLERCMARERWSVGEWEQIKGLLGDQQCVRPGPPLQPQAAVFISTCQCSHINPIYFRGLEWHR